MATKRPLILVDGDPLVYSCGFAAQKTLIGIVAEKEGKAESFAFEGVAELKKWQKASPGWEIKARHETQEVEPVEFCLYSVKNQLKILAQRGALAIYLTGTGNFRAQLAKHIDYKGNRTRPRPIHYQAIRDYLVDYHGAIVVDGREADDELSIVAHRRSNVVIASCDKDLDQIPGMHYDYWRDVEYEVSPEDAQRWFWIQCIAGDPTDNVPGCWKVGPRRAADIVDYARSVDADIWDVVIGAYFRSQSVPGCPYEAIDAYDIALETARMVYIQQKPGELWNPPPEPHGQIAAGRNVDD